MLTTLLVGVLCGLLAAMAWTQPAAAQTLQPPAEWSLDGDAPPPAPGSVVPPTRAIWTMNEDEYAAWMGDGDGQGAGVAHAASTQIIDSEEHKHAVFNAEHVLFLPRTRFEPQLSTRMGYGVASAAKLSSFPVAVQLNAGWYQDWTVKASPPAPNDIEFVQTIRLHQDLTCPVGTDFDRTRCPYLEPYSYSTEPGLSVIRLTILARPGNLWLLGNEMDRMDWGNPNAAGGATIGSQDEMLPELYATAYHDLYYFIKELDPTAQVAIGGIIQPTPLRLQYLTQVWDAYDSQYGGAMPVDVWNTHNFMIREGPADKWGAGVPPGVHAEQGEFVGQRDANGDRTYHIDMQIFDQQIRAFRQWMKDRGQQNKPLIVTEYGVLYPNASIFLNEDLYYQDGMFAYNVPDPVVNFMVATFDYFLNERDCELGYVADDCRLVQAWNWFSLDGFAGFSQHGQLLQSGGQTLTPAGQAFGEFARENLLPLSIPYPIPD